MKCDEKGRPIVNSHERTHSGNRTRFCNYPCSDDGNQRKKRITLYLLNLFLPFARSFVCVLNLAEKKEKRKRTETNQIEQIYK